MPRTHAKTKAKNITEWMHQLILFYFYSYFEIFSCSFQEKIQKLITVFFEISNLEMSETLKSMKK